MIILSNKLLAPYVRFLNGADTEPIDFVIINKTVSASTDYGKITKYIKCDRGNIRFFVKSRSKDMSGATINLNMQAGDVYTLCAIKKDNKYQILPISENTDKENLNLGHLRICNLNRDQRGISAYANDTCFVAEIPTDDICRYVELVPSKYQISIKASDSGKEVINCGMQSIKSGRYNTLFVLTPKTAAGEALGIYTIDASSYDSMYL